MELKCAGLVAQVTKTSVHQIDDIEKEISRLHFVITDLTGKGEYTLITLPSPPKTEQAESASNYVKNTPSAQVNSQTGVMDESSYFEDENNDEDDEEAPQISSNSNSEFDQKNTLDLQRQLREKFLEALELLDNPERAKEAESNLTFCLYRLEAHEAIRNEVLSLLPKLPWRSEAIAVCLGRFKDDEIVAGGLEEFINEHKVYSWHRANCLLALYQVSGAKSAASMCRKWLADTQLDWYARTMAARILARVPGQHAFFVECIKREQDGITDDPEVTAVLR